jgi:hypothetical protein
MLFANITNFSVQLPTIYLLFLYIPKGAQVKEFCPNGTKEECVRVTMSNVPCGKLHFRKIIHKHTDGENQNQHPIIKNLLLNQF